MQTKAAFAVFLALLPLLVSAAPLAPVAPRPPTISVYAGTCHKGAGADGKPVCRPKDPQVLMTSRPPRIGLTPLSAEKRGDPVCNDPCPDGADCILEKSTTFKPTPVCAGLNCPSGLTAKFTCKSKPEDVKQAQAKMDSKQPPKATPAKVGGQEGQKTGEQPAGQTPK